MPKHHDLSTQKYVDEVQKEELRQVRKAVATQSRNSIMFFLLSVIVFLLAMYTVFQMPNWMPAINTWLEQAGILTSNAV